MKTPHTGFTILFLIFVSLTTITWAQADTDPISGEHPEFALPSFWLVSLQMVFWLVVVTVLIFAVVWVIKKGMSPGKQSQDQKAIRLISQEPIGPGRSICLVRVLNQIHVVGVTNTQISYLSTLEADEVNMVNQSLENNLYQAGCLHAGGLEQRLKTGFDAFFQRIARKAAR